jgi:hypothetical protein
VLHAAIAACGHGDLIVAVAKTGLALDCVTALHPDASSWDQTREAERRWWAMEGAVTAMPPRSTQQRLMAAMAAALGSLTTRLFDVADDIAVLGEVRALFDSLDPLEA